MQARPLPMGFLFFLLSVLSPTVVAQDASISPASEVSIPRLIRFHGSIAGADASQSVVGVTFGLYREQQGGTPLWLETQNVLLDASGGFSVLLGGASRDGLPADLFPSADARWLEVKAEGLEPQARVPLVSVPYALKAGDAETVGGMTAAQIMALSQPTITATAAQGPPMVVVRGGRSGRTPDSTPATPGPRGSFSMSGSQATLEAYDDGAKVPLQLLINPKGGNVGIGTSTPGQKLSVAGIIESSGGFRFPDASVQTTASNLAGITAGSGLSGGGTTGNVALSADFNIVQARVTSSCPAGTAMGSIAANGTVNCNAIGGGGGGGATLGANTFTGQNVFTSLPTGVAVGQGPVYINPASANTTDTLFGVALNGTQKFRVDAQGAAYGKLAYFSGPVSIAVQGEAAEAGTSVGVWGKTASTAGMGMRAESTATTGQTFGLNATASSNDGTAVSGYNNSTATAAGPLGLGPVGVKGSANSQVGTGVQATSPYVGLHATTGTLFPKISGAPAAAGVFDSASPSFENPGADLIVGRSGLFSLTTKFRVDANGAVYASAYKDTAGNPAGGSVYSADGTAGGKSVFGKVTLGAGGNASVTLAGSAAFSSNTSYACVVTGASVTAGVARITQNSGSQFTINGTASADYNYVCVGK